jgi:hypothetical protein
MNGTTFYPVGSMYSATVGDETPGITVFFRNTPYDPEVGITEQEAYDTPITLTWNKVDQIDAIELRIISEDSEICGNYYRESDYFGYEMVELTRENYMNYLTVSMNPVGCSYSYGTFYAYATIEFTLKEGLGAASVCNIDAFVLKDYFLVESNIQTQEHSFTRIKDSEDQYLSLRFCGTSYTKHVDIMMGETIPVNNVVKWYGHIPTSLGIESISGYVFVPKQ